jgi:murein DD-endopeptidase MepM/ murein hydrolase activator NlpD
MGSYNSQYENYYSSLVNKRRNAGGYNSYGSYGNRRSRTPLIQGNFLVRRITIDLIGVFILFVFVIGCKVISTPQTAVAYKYSKELLNKSYDYSSMLASVKKFEFKKLEFKKFDITMYEDKFTNWMDSVKAKLTGGNTLKEDLKTNYVIPVDGQISLGFEKTREGIEIETKEGTSIVSVAEGRIKEIGENGQIGKFVIVDHGSGIESKYGNLSSILAKKDDFIGKGEIVGKSGAAGNSGVPHLYFELLYMGENKNPVEYLSFANR